ncbi:MAG: Sarcosine oxidase [Marmoricola sp.]|nr:Sarcosine oxidase [Marmoricola sp.]
MSSGRFGSHGSSRIYRRAYADGFYVALTGRADDEWVRLEDESGVTLRTRTGGLAAGAWLPELLGGLPGTPALPPLSVKQVEVFHHPHRDPAAAWPTLVQLAPQEGIELYALPSDSDGGPAPAYKIGQFDTDSTTTASTRDGIVDDGVRRVLRAYVERCLPGVEPEPVAEKTCLFTMTSDEDFVLDRVAVGGGQVVIAAPCSGHGAKFAPLTGVLVADLVEGVAPLPRFAFRAAGPATRHA